MSTLQPSTSPIPTILIIDDTPSNFEVLAEHLETHGFRVVVAQDGDEGLKRARYVQPELILLDVTMPIMDGFETCCRLKATHTTHDIPVIFMTASEDIPDKVKGFAAGAVDYVTKPFQLQEILARVGAQLTVRTMQKRLAQQNLQLQRAHDELEARVLQRTAELARANVDLKAEIAERMQAEAALRERDARIRRLIESNAIGVFFWGLNGAITEANDAFLNTIGYTQEDVRSGTVQWTAITPPEYHAVDQRMAETLKRTGRMPSYEKEYIHKDGRRVPVLIGGALFEGARDEGVAFVLDLTERKHAEERIRYLAHHDPLTGLPNRILFRDRVDQAIAQARRTDQKAAVVFIDLDNFKQINDSLGHDVGDDLLCRVGDRLKSCLRTGDSIARLGGDEFVICLQAMKHNDDAVPIAIKVLETLRKPFHSDRHELHITGSIGISVYPGDGQDGEELMRTADSALYHAKDKGRDNYQFFMPHLNELMRRRLTISTLMHHALQHNEFLLYYQPQLDLENQRIFSAEALLRWHTPTLGAISPSEFIKVAEETGMIVPLGEWVLRQACEQLKYWRQNGHPDLCVAINLSPCQFRRPGFPEFVGRTLADAGLPSAALEIEITENVLMKGRDNIDCLEHLVGMGIRLAVDDFGVGYSSLAYLQRFPLRALKIDQSFVQGIGNDPNDAAIVAAIIALARTLNLRVVAEGVERENQFLFLRERGCNAAQGHYFGAAVPADQFTEALRRQNS